jgi:hypothetical protein
MFSLPKKLGETREKELLPKEPQKPSPGAGIRVGGVRNAPASRYRMKPQGPKTNPNSQPPTQIWGLLWRVTTPAPPVPQHPVPQHPRPQRPPSLRQGAESHIPQASSP